MSIGLPNPSFSEPPLINKGQLCPASSELHLLFSLVPRPHTPGLGMKRTQAT